jgi:hypothetical protein
MAAVEGGDKAAHERQAQRVDLGTIPKVGDGRGYRLC